MRSNVLGSPKVSLESSDGAPSALNALIIGTVATLISFGIAGLIFHLRLMIEVAPLVKARPEIAQVSLSPYDIAPIIWIVAGAAAIQSKKWVAQLVAGLIGVILVYAFTLPMWAWSGPGDLLVMAQGVMNFQLEIQVLAALLNILLIVGWIVKRKPTT